MCESVGRDYHPIQPVTWDCTWILICVRGSENMMYVYAMAERKYTRTHLAVVISFPLVALSHHYWVSTVFALVRKYVWVCSEHHHTWRVCESVGRDYHPIQPVTWDCTWILICVRGSENMMYVYAMAERKYTRTHLAVVISFPLVALSHHYWVSTVFALVRTCVWVCSDHHHTKSFTWDCECESVY